MSEYWVEENIRPLSHQDSDRLLIDDIEPIVSVLKQKGIVSWHFLRENSSWRGNQNLQHVRLRFRAKDLVHLKRIRGILKSELDSLQQNGLIRDHYVGCQGNPVRWYSKYYQGESGEFDEQVPNPQGWSLVQKYLEVGSEMALLLIRGRLNRIRLGSNYVFDMSHYFPNQCRHYRHLITIDGWSLVAYDPINPSP